MAGSARMWAEEQNTRHSFSSHFTCFCYAEVIYCGIFFQEFNEYFFFSFSYDECVGPGATQIYIPTDDPPPYSLTDPCQRNEIPRNTCIRQEEEAASGTADAAVRLQDLQQPSSALAVISQCGGCTPVRDSGV